jgi:hypothetical protein
MMQTYNNDLRQQTRARRALLDWLRRLACRNSSVLRSLRGGNERNITKPLADRFWAGNALYRPISAQAQLGLRLFALAMIFVSRLESRSRQERVAPFGSVRRNISRTC